MDLFNGNMKGDEEGEYMFTGGKECTRVVIYPRYIIDDGKVKEEVEKMIVGEKVDSSGRGIN